jgi:hypothetical protein
MRGWRPHAGRQSGPMSILDDRCYRSRRASCRDEFRCGCVEGNRDGRGGNAGRTAAASPLEREPLDRLPVLLGAGDDGKKDFLGGRGRRRRTGRKKWRPGWVEDSFERRDGSRSVHARGRRGVVLRKNGRRRGSPDLSKFGVVVNGGRGYCGNRLQDRDVDGN